MLCECIARKLTNGLHFGYFYYLCSMRGKIVILALVAAVLTCCKGSDERKSVVARKFTHDVLLRTTPVKDQGTSDICWAYAMLATIETEHLMQGDSVNLSADYLAYMLMREQAVRRAVTGSQPVFTRGTLPMALRLMHRYGMEPYDTYRAKESASFEGVARHLRLMADDQYHHPKPLSEFDGSVVQALDEMMGMVPHFVFMLSCEYTPGEFARSVCRAHEYEGITSVMHHRYFEDVDLELADNYYHDTFLNLPLDTLVARVDRCLLSGHPVAWEGDTSELGFSFIHGLAVMPSGERATAESRQRAFDTHRTTDDHCMEIVGMAHDEKGGKWYVCKNSWGADNPYRGFMYMSEDYFRMKTLVVMMPREV